METVPTVSVLMTAYNREKYIAEAVESVLASTYRDFELIIVDDGSTDRTVEIARAYQQSDRRVQVYQNAKNLGDYKNRNRAAEFARGKYLKYLDSDDFLYPWGLGCMVDSMEKFPRAALGLSRFAFESPHPFELLPEKVYEMHFFGTTILGSAPTSAIIRTGAFRQVGGFSGTNFIGDGELWLRLSARFPLVIVPDGTTWWRRHPQQEMVFGQETYPILRHQVDHAAVVAAECPLNEAQKKSAMKRIRRKHARWVLGLLIRKRKLAFARYALKQAPGFSILDLPGGLLRVSS